MHASLVAGEAPVDGAAEVAHAARLQEWPRTVGSSPVADLDQATGEQAWKRLQRREGRVGAGLGDARLAPASWLARAEYGLHGDQGAEGEQGASCEG